jgi:predicted RNA-binding protein with RPS1 domain
LSSFDPASQASPTDAAESTAESQPTNITPSSDATAQTGQSAAQDAEVRRRQILIGSQRDPVAYRARQRRDWTPVDSQQPKKSQGRKDRETKEPEAAGKGEAKRSGNQTTAATAGKEPGPGNSAPNRSLPPSLPSAPAPVVAAPEVLSQPSAPELASQIVAAIGIPQAHVPRPSVRDSLSSDMEDELNRAMGDASMDDLLGAGPSGGETSLELESLQTGRVVAIRRDDVFVEFGGREQGIVSLQLLDTPPEVGSELKVVVQRLNAEDGLYELSLPNRAVQVEDWSDLSEGMLVDAQVTGHNTGGLECEVNHIRGFVPVSQIALHRVEDLAQFVGQRFTCVITEANPERRNLVLSRRAVLEREREETRQQVLESLRPGQIRDGVVRKLMDFGAFVDLGGVDGLLHISQLAWGRVKHPSDVLQEGQAIRVRVDRVDPETGKISLAYRDLMDSPWTTATTKYLPNTVVHGTVTKLMDFGAFVEVEPGIEGLVHISELSHKRVFRCSDVVKEGQQVEVMVLSVDPEAQRMSLSMKELSAPPEPEKKEDDVGEPAPSKKKHQKPTGPLLGGIGKKTGDRFGLKW